MQLLSAEWLHAGCFLLGQTAQAKVLASINPKAVLLFLP
jgi:hypothetical protein